MGPGGPGKELTGLRGGGARAKPEERAGPHSETSTASGSPLDEVPASSPLIFVSQVPAVLSTPTPGSCTCRSF